MLLKKKKKAGEDTTNVSPQKTAFLFPCSFSGYFRTLVTTFPFHFSNDRCVNKIINCCVCPKFIYIAQIKGKLIIFLPPTKTKKSTKSRSGCGARAMELK